MLNMENLIRKEAVRAHDPKPKINDTLGIRFCILCAKMPLSGSGKVGVSQCGLGQPSVICTFASTNSTMKMSQDPSHLTPHPRQELMAGALRQALLQNAIIFCL